MQTENSKTTITKKLAAQVQLETAIKLYFENRDLVSAFTLCSASDGILEGIWSKEQTNIRAKTYVPGKEIKFSAKEEWDFQIKDEYKKDGWYYYNRAQNFFKHADKDHTSELEFEGPAITALKIFLTIRNFFLVFEETTTAMSFFTSWYMTINPETIKKDSAIYAEIKRQNFQLERYSHKEITAEAYDKLRSMCPHLFLRN